MASLSCSLRNLSSQHAVSLVVERGLSKPHVACGVLAPQPGISCIERQILSYWTTREVPHPKQYCDQLPNICPSSYISQSDTTCLCQKLVCLLPASSLEKRIFENRGTVSFIHSYILPQVFIK